MTGTMTVPARIVIAPSVLLSAHLDNAVREQARAIGIAACVSKTEASRLPEVIRTVLQQK
jgi:hypothetical protein